MYGAKVVDFIEVVVVDSPGCGVVKLCVGTRLCERIVERL